jgi:hypothetical protein
MRGPNSQLVGSDTQPGAPCGSVAPMSGCLGLIALSCEGEEGKSLISTRDHIFKNYDQKSCA